MHKYILKNLLLSLIFVLAFFSLANSTVISFDDLGQGLVPDSYAGITWGTSTLSQPYADSTSFVVMNDPTYATPNSSPNFVINGYGVPDLWFEFSSPVTFQGAWFSSPLNNGYAAEKVRFVDNLGQTSQWLGLLDTPQFLAADFLNSTKIFIEPILTFSGTEINGGWYATDDITYNSSTPVPEPATILLLTAGLIGIAVFRKKHITI